MTTQYLGSSDQGPQFLSVEDGKKTIMHSIAAWLIEDGKASAVLFPEPRNDAVIFYQNAGSQVVTEMNTGKTFQTIGKALEALQ